MMVYFARKVSTQCFLPENAAQEYIEEKGGSLLSVPAFESRDDADAEAKKQNSKQKENKQEQWYVHEFLVEGREKPDYIYCVVPPVN